ncbi:hypothetical protein [Quisquiliibacterium transsilvanicum]|uniref:Uncharacterized protein n=2 Tax=Quisquiliibacterium transsilvanicum TaxID=1549638 RepID=A0A7W8M9Y4_9BURK|nr:hypothetical protein [Quisquiliibacterium transsilvanicum]
MTRNRSTIAGLMLATAIPVVAVAYALQVLNGVPLADEWRWLRNLLIPHLRGEIGFGDYLAGEYAFLGHTHFLTLLAFYLDHRWAGLDLERLAQFGLVFYVAGYALLVSYLRAHEPRPAPAQWLALAALAAAYFPLTTDFPWGLVVFEYLYYFGALALLLVFDAYLRGRLALWAPVLGFFLAPVLLESFGPVAVAACLAVYFAGFRRRAGGLLAPVALVLGHVAAWLLMYLLLGAGQPTASTSRWVVMQALLANPQDVVLSLLISLSQPLADRAVLGHWLPEGFRWAQAAIGLAGGALVLAVLWTWRRRLRAGDSELPLLLAAFSLAAWALILLTRYLDFGVAVMDAQRFTRFFVPWYLAVAAALYLGRFRLAQAATVLALLLVPFLCGAAFQFRNAVHVNAYFDGAAQALRQEPPDSQALSRYIGQCGQSYCDDTISFLRGSGLPLFRAGQAAPAQ